MKVLPAYCHFFQLRNVKKYRKQFQVYNRKQPDTFVQGKMNSRCWEYDTS